MSNETRPNSEHPLKKQLENIETYLRWSREAVEATMYEPFTEVYPLDRCLQEIKEAQQAVKNAKAWEVVMQALGTNESKCNEA